MSAFRPDSPREPSEKNKRPHESVDYIAHNSAKNRREAAPSVEAVEAKLSGLNVTHKIGKTTSSIPISLPSNSPLEISGRKHPLPHGSPTQTAAANAARRRAKSQSNTTSDSVPELRLDDSNHSSLVRQSSLPGTASEQLAASTDLMSRERDLPSGAPFSVAIDSRETKFEPKNQTKYTSYQLSVTVARNPEQGGGVNNWKVMHRYSEFVEFRSQLRRANLSVTHLPPKTWQSNFLDSFLDARQYALANWVAQLPSIFLLGETAENLIRSFLISSNMMQQQDGSGDSVGGGDGAIHSNPSTPSPSRLKPLDADESGAVGEVVVGGLLSGGGGSSGASMMIGATTAAGGRSNTYTPDRTKRQVVSMANFDLLKVLGKGSYGKVILVRKKDGKDVGECYAMKVLKKRHVHQKRQVEHTKTERDVLASIKHPFIVKLHYAFQTGDKLHFVLDYASGGELFFHLQKHGRFPPKLALFYTAELTMAFGELHSRAVVFRDLKPGNFFLPFLSSLSFFLLFVFCCGCCICCCSIQQTPDFSPLFFVSNLTHRKCSYWW